VKVLTIALPFEPLVQWISRRPLWQWLANAETARRWSTFAL